MNKISSLGASVAALALFASLPSAANAALVQSVGNNGSLPILALNLDNSGITGVATQSGGAVYNTTHPGFAAMPAPGTVGNFLAAGPSNNGNATLTFINPLSYLSFLWGSPDSYNALTINTNLGTYNYTAASANVNPVNGDQNFA